jgi:hypothetical protein
MTGRLDLFLAAHMRPSPDLDARLSEHAIDAALLGEAKAWAQDYGLANPLNPTRALLYIMFGPPVREGLNEVVYTLGLWPAHEFSWLIDSAGNASYLGFSLIQAPDTSLWAPHNFSIARLIFQPFFHTGKEIEASLGPPDLDLSWGPAWAWHYGITGVDGDLVLDFDFGLLREVRQEARAPRD